MDLNNFSGIEDLLKYLGYEKMTEVDDDENSNKFNESSSKKNKNHCNSNIDESEEWFSKLNLDIPNGFQNISPILFVTIGEVIGDIMSGQLPDNVANIISNFIILIGQIIETYGTQHQYFEIGPGRYFKYAYKNIENPFLNQDMNPKEDLNNISNLTKDGTANNDDLNECNDSIKKLHDISNIYFKLEKLQCDVRKIKTKMYELEKRIDNIEGSK